MWTEKKKESLGVISAYKRGSIDRYLISTDIWESPPGAFPCLCHVCEAILDFPCISQMGGIPILLSPRV